MMTDDSILVGYSAGTYEHYKHPESFEHEVEQGVWIAMDEARNQFLEDPSRHTQYTLLQFPKPTDSDQGRSFALSTKEIKYEADIDEEILELNYIPITNNHLYLGTVECFMCVWNIVRLDVAPAKRGKPASKPLSRAAQQLLEREERKKKGNAKGFGNSGKNFRLETDNSKFFTPRNARNSDNAYPEEPMSS